jgi:hypothetical protein
MPALPKNTRKQCWGPVTFWCGSGSPDPYLCLMDPDPISDPTTFFIDFKDAKKIFFSYFFLITYPQAHHLQTKKFNFLQRLCVQILFCRHYFSLLRRKGNMDPDPDPRGSKTCGSGSGSPTLLGREGTADRHIIAQIPSSCNFLSHARAFISKKEVQYLCFLHNRSTSGGAHSDLHIVGVEGQPEHRRLFPHR